MNLRNSKKNIKKLENEIEALLIAIVRETASHQFYLGLIKKHKDTGAAGIFRQLAKEESHHKKTLDKKLLELQAELEALK